MNDIYEMGFVALCLGLVILLGYFEDKKEQKKLKEYLRKLSVIFYKYKN